MTGLPLCWSHGKARVLTTAAMLDACDFRLPGGTFAPFARAPWVGTLDDPGVSGHLRVLGGDFVGLPFGIGRPIQNPPAEWANLLTGPTAGLVHGPAAEEEWTVVAAEEGRVTLALDYPASSAVRRVERDIAGRQGEAALDFTFRIHARRRAAISVGLHPILRLPAAPGRLQLCADFAFGLTHPGYGGHEFDRLSSVPSHAGTLDVSHLPLHPKADLNLQLCGMRGPLRAIYLDEGAGVELDWDRNLLPSLQIWHTDCGIAGSPWHNRYRGLGLEPVASAFDLDTAVSSGPNPINARGIATSAQIDPAAPLSIRHSIRAFSA